MTSLIPSQPNTYSWDIWRGSSGRWPVLVSHSLVILWATGSHYREECCCGAVLSQRWQASQTGSPSHTAQIEHKWLQYCHTHIWYVHSFSHPTPQYMDMFYPCALKVNMHIIQHCSVPFWILYPFFFPCLRSSCQGSKFESSSRVTLLRPQRTRGGI